MTRTDDQSRGVLGFPGGRPTLPRISRPKHRNTTERHPEERTEDGAEDRPEERSPNPTETASAEVNGHDTVDGTFSEYFTTESLFEPIAQDPSTNGTAPADPYTVLGVTRQASWEQVAKAHRKLVAKLHPDRHVDADESTRAAVERRVRDVNEAYSTIRRERAPSRS